MVDWFSSRRGLCLIVFGNRFWGCWVTFDVVWFVILGFNLSRYEWLFVERCLLDGVVFDEVGVGWLVFILFVFLRKTVCVGVV